MKRIFFPIIVITLLSIAFSGCNHGAAKNLENADDTVDTILVDTVEADSIIYDEEYGDVRYYEDEYLYFRYPAEYQCVEDENGAIAIYNKRNRDNYMTFSYHDVRPNENAESAVKKIVINLLQRYPDAVLIKSSNSPIPPENDSMRSIYYAIVRLGEESEPTTFWVSSVLMKNGHLHITTSTSDNEHDANVFNAVLRTIIMK